MQYILPYLFYYFIIIIFYILSYLFYYFIIIIASPSRIFQLAATILWEIYTLLAVSRRRGPLNCINVSLSRASRESLFD